MDKLQIIFMTEANEMLADIEKGLLLLETDSSNKECISSVFRAMHTLKGSAGMFGFETIGAITHHLETIYESIRDGQSQLTTDILTITFASLDHLQKLLHDPQSKDQSLTIAQENLIEAIKELATVSTKTETPVEKAEAAPEVYYISFEPTEGILRNGTNTLYLVDDLLALGSGMALPYFKNLPPLNDINPDSNYTAFEVLLETSRTVAEIRDVFMFVESECTLTIQKSNLSGLKLDEHARKQVRQGHDISKPGGFDSLLAALAPGAKPQEVTEAKKTRATGSSIRVSSERIDELMNLVSELVTTQARLSLFSTQNNSVELSTISENVEKITRRLRDNAFTMSLIPIESLVVRFQRLVRDLSLELKKDIVFKAEGTETEIDKSIIEKLTDPLLHLLRNSLDHGIEMPEERVRKGKPKQGTVLFKAYYSGANVVIEISDDGAGVNLEKVRKKAIAKGLIDEAAHLDEKEILHLIFLPGFSTADQITGVSGRGVGMDVVRRNVSDIRGEVDVTSKAGEGTTFIIKLPLTLSIIDGLLVRIGQTDFILPLTSVNKCYEVETKTLQETFNQWVTLEGQRTPFLFLRKDFHINHGAPALSQVIKVAHEGRHVGLAVDKIIGEYQAVLKPLSEQYKDQDEFSGATILGDGSVALVLDPSKLIKKLVQEHHLNLKSI